MIREGDLVSLICSSDNLQLEWERHGLCIDVEHPSGWILVYHGEEENPTLWPPELIILIQSGSMR